MAKIFINPGHSLNGDPDCGACNPNTGLREADIAANVGAKVKDILEQAEHEVILIQSNNLEGEDPTCPNVTGTANAENCDVFISLHCNAANQTARGTEAEVYSCGGAGEKLARCIMNQLVSTLQAIDGNIPDRGIKKRPDLCVLRETSMPATLIEMAFIDQDDDAAILENHQDEIAKAVADGVANYFA
jgi:N-acetylmuramoyl-L-alanine amidase